MLAGLTAQLEMRVGENDSFPESPEGGGGGLSMPKLFRLFEATAMEAIREYLAPEVQWLETEVKIRFLAPVPSGMTVTAHALLKEVGENRLRFLVDAHDEMEKVAEGEIEGVLVSKDHLLDSLREKREKVKTEVRFGQR